ncbi:MAG: hypothetical protein ACR2K2_15200, partial [Mycobacteriales bacterium]
MGIYLRRSGQWSYDEIVHEQASFASLALAELLEHMYDDGMPEEPADDALAGAAPGSDGGAAPASDGGGLRRGQARDALHTAALEAMT